MKPLRPTLAARRAQRVLTGTSYYGDSAPKQRDMNEHLGYAAWTADAANGTDRRCWKEPTVITHGALMPTAESDASTLGRQDVRKSLMCPDSSGVRR